jgi:Leucine-rich repeat (LRR) protein
MNRRFGIFLSVVVTLVGSASAFAEDEKAVERLQSRGMQVIRDGETVVAVKGFRARDGDLKDVKRFPKLRVLELTNSQITDAGLAELADLTALEEIQLEFSPNIKGSGLKHLVGNKKLKALDVGIGQIDDEALRALRKAGLLHTLQRLFGPNERPQSDDAIRSLWLAQGVTDVGIAELVGLPGLQSLQLHGPNFSDRSMVVLGKMPALRELTMRGARVTDVGLREIAGLKHLEVLIIDDAPITDDGLKTIGEFRSLHTLYLNSPRIKGEGFRHLAGLPLRMLFLCGSITDNYLRVLRETKLMHTLYHAQNIYRLPARSEKDIDSLDLSRQPITAAGLKELKDLPGLKILRLNGVPIKAEEFVNLSGVPSLEVVTFDPGTVSDEALRTLARHDLIHLLAAEARGKNQPLKAVPRMNLSGQPITDEGLKTIRTVTALADLNLLGTMVSDAGVNELTGMPALTTLNLRDTRVTNKGLTLLLESKTLKRIDLGPKQVNDETLALLHRRDRLTLLSLTRCAYGEPRSAANVIGFVLSDTLVTDAAMPVLAAYPKLEFVNLRHTRVTDAGVTELQRNFPKLRVFR